MDYEETLISNPNNNILTNTFSYLIEILTSDKSEMEKIKALILIEQEYQSIDEERVYNLFKIFEELLNQNDLVQSEYLKGQIIMTATSLLITLDALKNYPNIFVNFVDNILIDSIKKVKLGQNLFIREICCQCLEEIEIEYSGVLFSLMGKKNIEIFELHNIEDINIKKNDPSDNSIRSLPTVFNNNKNNYSLISSYNFVGNIEYKKIELINEGLNILIEEENFYVFQYYLSLYSKILSDMLIFYTYQHSFICGEEMKELRVKFGLDNEPKSLIEIISQHPLFKEINFASQKNKGIKTTVPFQILKNNPSKSSNILNIKETKYFQYFCMFEFFKHFNNQFEKKIMIKQELTNLVKKSFSLIIPLLPKVSEIIKSNIWNNLILIIPLVDLNEGALLPHFNYFHLNNYSPLLTVMTIKIIQKFTTKIPRRFLFKVLYKLSLLFKDPRNSSNIKTLLVKWLSNLSFDDLLSKSMILNQLSSVPFDNIGLIKEKIKSAFMLLNINQKEHQLQKIYLFVTSSSLILDKYKYYPIFSKFLKSLFKFYLLTIVNFPFKDIICNLCDIVKNNLREIPRILPNLINLLNLVKGLKDNEEVQSEKMSFHSIYHFMILQLSDFIKNFNPFSRLNRLYELFLLISKDNTISPGNIITGLLNLYSEFKNANNWRLEKNILEISRVLITNHKISTLKESNFKDLLKSLMNNSFDYGIREKAKLYYQLINNVEKDLTIKYLNGNIDINNFEIQLSYKYFDYEDKLVDIVLINQTAKERNIDMLFDRGTAIIERNKKKIDSILIGDSSKKESNSLCFLNALIDKTNESKIDSCRKIEVSDLLNLYISNEYINDLTENKNIEKTKIFSVNIQTSFTENSIQIAEETKFIKDYLSCVSSGRAEIKLPISIRIAKNTIKKIFCASIIIGDVPHIDIISPILLPYLEFSSSTEEVFPFYYKTYVIIFANLPIPTTMKVRIIFFDENGACCTGLLKNVQIVFEDFFVPVLFPQVYEKEKQKYISMLFSYFWKEFKKEGLVNTNKTICLSKSEMIKKIKQKLLKFLVQEDFEKNIVNKNKESKDSYDFTLDYFLEPTHHTNYEAENSSYTLAKAIIFIPEKFHLLFKIKISDFSTIFEIRSDCMPILENIDDYFNSW